MYACILENERGFFEGGAQTRESVSHFSRPAPTALAFVNDSVPVLYPEILTAVNLYSVLQYHVLAISRKAG